MPESEVAKYKDDEFVPEEVHGSEKAGRRRKKYEKGTFIFHLAGRDREKSASYYTPECLTQCVVKYALKELLKDKKADDILKLTVCEPAGRGRPECKGTGAPRADRLSDRGRRRRPGIRFPRDAAQLRHPTGAERRLSQGGAGSGATFGRRAHDERLHAPAPG